MDSSNLMEKELWSYPNCLICLEPVIIFDNREKLKLLFNCLKISGETEASLCLKCDETLAKFGKLFDSNLDSEKVRLEVDYWLELIQSAIKNSNQSLKELSSSTRSVRELLMNKCGELMQCPKAQVILEKLDINRININRSTPTDGDLDNTRAFPCQKCSKIFPTISKLKKHQLCVHPKSLLPCEICKKQFKYWKQLENHISSAHKKIKHTCQVEGCNKSYSYKRTLAIHSKLAHPSNEAPLPPEIKRFKCSKCLKIFQHQSGLRSHFDSVHLHLKPFKCDICDKSFARPRELEIHKATPHFREEAPPNSKTFPCQKCDRVYDSSFVLKRHQRIHRDGRFACAICHKTFKDREGLKRHVSAIHENQRHHCQVPGCDKNYSQRPDLVIHYKLKHPNVDFKMFKNTSNNPGTEEKPENGERNSDYQTLETLCEDCNYKTVSKAKDCIKNSHKIFTIVECNLCKKHFVSIDLFKLHVGRCLGGLK